MYIFAQKNFSNDDFLADMALRMSDFDDFDNDWVSWKLAQRYHFVFAFHSEIFFFLENQDESKNTKWSFSRPFVDQTLGQ